MVFKDNYDLIFITTHQNNEYIYSLLNSIKCSEDLKLFVLVLSQEVEVDLDVSEISYKVSILSIDKMPLSNARNIGLSFLKRNGIGGDFIMFPDDDTTFDEFFFVNFKEVCLPSKNYIIPIYCEGSNKKLYLGKKLENGLGLNYKHHYMIGSPNQVINYYNNIDNLYFDENLGVGSIYGSCEDFDLFIRLIKSGEHFIFTDRLYNFHPDKSDSIAKLNSKLLYKRITSYSMGFIYTVKKHKIFSLLPYFFIRPILASGYYLLKLKPKLSVVYFKLFFFRVINLLTFSNK